MTSLKGAVRGAGAGAAGTTAPSLTTNADMAIRGRRAGLVRNPPSALMRPLLGHPAEHRITTRQCGYASSMVDDPGRFLSPREQRAAAQALRAGLVRSGFDVAELSMATVALDPDTLAPAELARVLRGDHDAPRLTAHEHDVLAQALNDHFVGRGDGHLIRYSADLA